MDLTHLSDGVHKRKLKKRVGRGIGSGHGKTASRGHKGQYASAGAELPSTLFEGGQTPLFRRMPKRGFTNGRHQLYTVALTLETLGRYFVAGASISLAMLKERNVIRHDVKVVRVIGNTTDKAFHLKQLYASKGAQEAIKKAGGTIEA
jgi:large subunit ribosomal protein L15